jgi:hypothetical protein
MTSKANLHKRTANSLPLSRLTGHLKRPRRSRNNNIRRYRCLASLSVFMSMAAVKELARASATAIHSTVR